jgi:Na+/melibiose symporter-like transporter
VHSKLDTVKWAWTLANTSLVVPVILGLLVWYAAIQGIEKEREQLRQIITSLAERQNDIIKMLVAEHAANLAKPDKVSAIQSSTAPENSNSKAARTR